MSSKKAKPKQTLKVLNILTFSSQDVCVLVIYKMLSCREFLPLEKTVPVQQLR